MVKKIDIEKRKITFLIDAIMKLFEERVSNLIAIGVQICGLF